MYYNTQNFFSRTEQGHILVFDEVKDYKSDMRVSVNPKDLLLGSINVFIPHPGLHNTFLFSIANIL
jgi:hypothetical protein